MRYGLMLLALVSGSAYAKNDLAVCESHFSKYEQEECITELIEEKKRDLRVTMASINAVVVGQEEYGISPGLSEDFNVNNEKYKAYSDSFCSLYLGAIGANMGTGSVIASMKCEFTMLEQRIKALDFITQPN